MQPYFLPYMGYFQLINAVDLFIVYDNIKYTKKGWINRNRLLQNGEDILFSLPLMNDSDSLHIDQRTLAPNFNPDTLLNQFKGAYRHAPYFAATYPLLEQIIHYEDTNLFQFLYYSIIKVCSHLGITTTFKISSNITINHTLKNQDKVIALCEAVGASVYVNAIGGIELYSRERFRKNSIDLRFIRSKFFEYSQFGNTFVPWLSIIDVMMFNPLSNVCAYLNTNYELL